MSGIRITGGSGGGGGGLIDHDHTGSGDGGNLTGALVDTYLEIVEQGADPAAPPVNRGRLYARDSGSGRTDPYWRGDGGSPVNLATPNHGVLTGVTPDQHHAQAHDHTTSDGSGVLTNDEHDGYSQYDQLASDPATPASGKLRLFAKSDGATTRLYYRSPTGTTYGPLDAPGAGSAWQHNHDANTDIAGGKLSGAAVDTYIDVEQQATAPSAPASGVARVYAADLGGRAQLYTRDATGTMMVGQILLASFTWDIPSLGGGAEAYTTVTVPGAELGDIVIGVSLERNWSADGLMAWGHVSATDTVRIGVTNFSTTTRDEAIGTFRVAVLKAV
jgi:hypothetical protein